MLYAVLGAVLWWAHGRLRAISDDPEAARASGLRLARWDFLFYAVLGTVVTSSVQIAGVLLVFTLLVVPTVMAYRCGCGGELRHLAFVLGGRRCWRWCWARRPATCWTCPRARPSSACSDCCWRGR